MAAALVQPDLASTQSQPRYVRLCPQHGMHTSTLVLRAVRNWTGTTEYVTCPRGHVVERWAVYDRLMKRVIGYGSEDAVTLVDGHCDDVIEAPKHESRRRPMRRRKWDR